MKYFVEHVYFFTRQSALPNGKEERGDSMTDRWMDDEHMEGQAHGKIMLLLHTLTIRGSDIASLVEFCPMV